MDAQVMIIETSSLKTVTAKAELNGFCYAITHKSNENDVIEVQIGISKSIQPEGSMISNVTYMGSVSYKDGYCNQTLSLLLSSSERQQITSDADSIFDQIKLSI